MISGIIAEFNPFHHGHAYLLEQAKGLKIVAMSGNFMQRGEPALVDKWTRAQMALENGADLVIELPFLVSVQAADYFADGAVRLLEHCGVDNLVFGTENLLDYQQLADTYVDKKDTAADFLENLPESLSYPQKTQLLWKELFGLEFTAATPNHVLGLAYTKAAAGRSMRLQPVQRQGAGFHSVEKTRFASATAIRAHLEDKDFLQRAMPSSHLLATSPQVSWANYFDLLKYQIISHPNLTTIYQVNQEMASRLRSVISDVESVEELVDKVSTKRYTKARVRRLLTYILVQARESDLPKALHVLGFTEKGQAHLKILKERVPLVTRIGREPWDEMTQQADRIYQLGHREIARQDIGRRPIRV